MTANEIYQMIARRGCRRGWMPGRTGSGAISAAPWLDTGAAGRGPDGAQRPEFPQMLRRYGASARSARARRTYAASWPAARDSGSDPPAPMVAVIRRQIRPVLPEDM
jgi:hypothetical protein